MRGELDTATEQHCMAKQGLDARGTPAGGHTPRPEPAHRSARTQRPKERSLP